MSTMSSFTREQSALNGVSAEIIAVTAGRHDVPAMDDFRLGLHLGPAITADCRCDGQHRRHIQAEGDLLFIPPGLPGTWQDDAACRFLRIHLAPALMHEAARQLGLDSTGLRLAPRLHFRDPALEHAARALFAVQSRDPLSDDPTSDDAMPDDRDGAMTQAAAGALGTALAFRLLQSADIRLPATARAGQGLSRRQQHRLEAYIEAHIGGSLSLGDLAALLDISVSHLTALFRHSYGSSPHQYILRRRLDLAEHLLGESDLPISEIALTAGFAHQSHLSSLLRRHRGVSPQQRRRVRTSA